MVSVEVHIVRFLKHLTLSWTVEQQKQTQLYSDLRTLRYICWMNSRYLLTSGYAVTADNLPHAANITGFEVALVQTDLQKLTFHQGQERGNVRRNGGR